MAGWTPMSLLVSWWARCHAFFLELFQHNCLLRCIVLAFLLLVVRRDDNEFLYLFLPRQILFPFEDLLSRYVSCSRYKLQIKSYKFTIAHMITCRSCLHYLVTPVYKIYIRFTGTIGLFFGDCQRPEGGKLKECIVPNQVSGSAKFGKCSKCRQRLAKLKEISINSYSNYKGKNCLRTNIIT